MSLSARRAWIEIDDMSGATGRILSLSARRAWIEMDADHAQDILTAVALRKESVDRNIKRTPLIRFCPGSLSARRAWIEISCDE